VAQPRPGPQSEADWQGAFIPPVPAGPQTEAGALPSTATWQSSVEPPPDPVVVPLVPLPPVPLDVLAPPAPPVEDPPAPVVVPVLDDAVPVPTVDVRWQAVESPFGPGMQTPVPHKAAYVSRCGGVSPSGVMMPASPPAPV